MDAKNNIKILRAEKNLSQEGLAKQVQVTQTAVSSWELGNSYPDMQTAFRLAAYFGVSIDYLMGLSAERSGLYSASNVSDGNFVQGSGSVMVGDGTRISKEEAEILRVYKDILNVRGRAKLMNFVFDLSDAAANQKGASGE